MSFSGMLSDRDRKRITYLLASTAANSPSGPSKYLRDLVKRTKWPDRFKLRAGGEWDGDPVVEAGRLVDFASNLGRIPSDVRTSFLGNLLSQLHEDLGHEGRQELASIMTAYEMLGTSDFDERLRELYRLPAVSLDAVPDQDYQISHEPEFEWMGPEDWDLQSFFRDKPIEFTAEFLFAFSKRAFSVCRIEDSNGVSWGSGALVGPRLVITNYHVLEALGHGKIDNIENNIIFNFGYHVEPTGEQPASILIKPGSANPIVKASTVESLDYVLLRVSDNIAGFPLIGPIPIALNQVKRNDFLTIMHYPHQETMRVIFARNAVVQVLDGIQRIQYFSSTKSGSSGAPALDDKWNLTALHQSSQGGYKRQGIPIHAILDDAGSCLV